MKTKNVKRLEQKLQKKFNTSITCSLVDDSIKLEGQLEKWQEVVDAGYFAAKYPFKQVVNDISLLSGASTFSTPQYDSGSENLDHSEPNPPSNESIQKCDILIIGAGIIGSSIARELSKYNLNIVLVEKDYDVAVHTSSRNDGMIHPGIAAPSKSLKCKLNVRGSKLYHRVSEELGVPIRWCGSSILFRSRISKILKPFFWIKAKKIGMPGLSFMNTKAVYENEPHLAKGVVWGVSCASAGVTSPYKMTVAYAENAVMNGVQLYLNTAVTGMSSDGLEITSVHTSKGDFESTLIINAAGVYSDVIAEMANDRYFSIHPRKGEVVLLDKKKSHLVNGILGFASDRSSKNTKGGGVIKTYEGNILIGPNAVETPFREDYSTDRESIAQMLDLKLPQVEGLKKDDTITYFAGIRASTYKEDFIIERSNRVDNLIHVAGIQSPGFASAPAIAEMVESLVNDFYNERSSLPLKMSIKKDWNPIRPAIPDLANMAYDERQSYIVKNPDFGEIVCRCEEISRGEIIEALKSPIPITSVDGVKRRVRAGMGRCQGGFCLPLVMDIIHEETGLAHHLITKKAGQSQIVVQRNTLERSGDSV